MLKWPHGLCAAYYIFVDTMYSLIWRVFYCVLFSIFFHSSSRHASWVCLSKETPIYLSTEKNYDFVSLAGALHVFIAILFSVNFDIITSETYGEEAAKKTTQPKRKENPVSSCIDRMSPLRCTVALCLGPVFVCVHEWREDCFVIVMCIVSMLF